MVAGNVALYGCGLVWLTCLVYLFARPPAGGILAIGLYPFLLGDIIKIGLATAILPSTWKIFRHFRVDKIAKM
jgi:biotin transport system substrate-specific component